MTQSNSFSPEILRGYPRQAEPPLQLLREVMLGVPEISTVTAIAQPAIQEWDRQVNQPVFTIATLGMIRHALVEPAFQDEQLAA